MNKTLHMFNGLNGSTKIPFALDKFTTARPIAASNLEAGTILFGVGVPAGIEVKDTVTQVNEIVLGYYQTLGKGGVA